MNDKELELSCQRNIYTKIDETKKELDEKIDTIKDDVTDLKLEIIPRLDVYNEQLKIHIAASKANGERLKHVEDHVISVQAFFKIATKVIATMIGLGTLIGMLWAVFVVISK